MELNCHYFHEEKVPYQFHDETIFDMIWDKENHSFSLKFEQCFTSEGEVLRKPILKFYGVQEKECCVIFQRPSSSCKMQVEQSPYTEWNGFETSLDGLVQTYSPQGFESPYGILKNGTIVWMNFYRAKRGCIIQGIWTGDKDFEWYRVQIELCYSNRNLLFYKEL